MAEVAVVARDANIWKWEEVVMFVAIVSFNLFFLPSRSHRRNNFPVMRWGIERRIIALYGGIVEQEKKRRHARWSTVQRECS
jgi:hypothetical protein